MWGKARKKPIVVEYREPIASDTHYGREEVRTREGMLYAILGQDYIIKGIRGEIYPIGKDIFEQTYDVVEPIPQSSNQKVNVWK